MEAPFTDWYLPVGHKVQEVTTPPIAYFPVGQTVHLVALNSSEYVPAGQLEHALTPPLEYVPALQELQWPATLPE
jgi:hypothetical protein